MRVKVRYDRLDESQRRAHSEFREGLQDMAVGVQGAAQSIAPVDTGFMRANIKTHPGYPVTTVESEASYSGYVEFGTRYQHPQPFMRPAYEQSRLSSLEHLRQRLKRSLG